MAAACAQAGQSKTTAPMPRRDVRERPNVHHTTDLIASLRALHHCHTRCAQRQGPQRQSQGGTRWHVHRVPIEPSSESNRSSR
eukprot:609066-Alexandrium_andersonii.AAC.1